MRYPITVIAGKNGSGKTTALALAACAFHNDEDGFNPFERKYPYYTFSEFFVQSIEEIAPEGIRVRFEILYDKWRITSSNRDRAGPLWQSRHKRRGGRWSNYDSRVNRNVVFFGIDRVVPHSEKSVSKSYRREFKSLPPEALDDKVRKTVGSILGRDYEKLWFKGHSKYRLPMVEADGITCSGFNMGAGESALISIFSTIYSCEESLLIVIDEIELGLHEEAQARLVRELGQLCYDRHIQVICTTHSPAILSAIPPEGRFFLERVSGNTTVLPEISADFATGKLSGKSVAELDIFVEDEVSRCVVEALLDTDARLRTNIMPIGSANALIHQMAARHKETDSREACVILDGDMATEKDGLVSGFIKDLESPKSESLSRSWISERLHFLPGDTWPEKWILSKNADGAFDALADEFGISKDRLTNAIDDASRRGKHKEFQALGESLALDETTIRTRFTKCAVALEPIGGFREMVAGFLD
jgi:predicted ATPase